MSAEALSTRSLLRLVSSFTTAGLVLGGVVGAAAIATVGPYLAMGLAIWSGQTTEPIQPVLSYPWVWTVLGALTWGIGVWGEHRRSGARPYPVLSWTGGLIVALLPMIQLWRLWGESTL